MPKSTMSPRIVLLPFVKAAKGNRSAPAAPIAMQNEASALRRVEMIASGQSSIYVGAIALKHTLEHESDLWGETVELARGGTIPLEETDDF